MKKLIVLSFLIFVLAIATAGGVRSMTQHQLKMPLIMAGAPVTSTPEPTMTPTSTLTPTPTVTPVPGELWVYILRFGNTGDTSTTYASVPGIGYEIKGQKVEKTLNITAYCPEGVECIMDPVPPDFPPECDFETGKWCQIEKLEFDSNAKQACGTQFPFNCVDAE
jgi:hypothetical protein